MAANDAKPCANTCLRVVPDIELSIIDTKELALKILKNSRNTKYFVVGFI
eukprot:CAMPEP_0171454114 /NCGR_PEP_ID=MMETSP0945-20130129/1535_1 /TAXON_ID=109269 /ORGANISM="Vaucheria litorea, Strain CCMP2940" /LENGTH=49 /DNA_ID= /DNA_START= /DNA_END= /DNA_ORIENTATION=